MRILAVGGGSGGHVTPVAATLKALSRTHPGEDEMRVWCDKAFYTQCVTTLDRIDVPVRIDTIIAGKFRRYTSISMVQHLLRFRTIVLPNSIDGIKILIGFIQSFCKLIIWRPDVVFCKGGFVCLPVGMAAHLLRIPIVIHDSDAHPGLTNRILSKWATKIATGAPLEHYSYPPGKARYVGIPVDDRLRVYSATEQAEAKRLLGLIGDVPLVVVTGGGLGAEAINTAIVAELPGLLRMAQVILISGTGQYEVIREATKKYAHNERFQLHAFVSDKMVDMLIAANVVVARAGATTLLELAALGKPTVLVPNPYLTGDHQVKNAKIYADAAAVLLIDEVQMESHPSLITNAVQSLLTDTALQHRYAKAIHGFAHPNAARDVATMIRSAAHKARS